MPMNGIDLELKQAKTIRLLFWAGVGLLVSEIWKQGYLFFFVNDRQFDTWFFPFQLCSVPMYLCLLLPFLGEKARQTALNFLWDFSFFGALLALLYPEDILSRPWPLMLHGFLWHIVLLAVSLTVFFTGMADRTWSAYFRAGVWLLVFCGIATVLNVLLEGKGLPATYPDMFYLTPYHLTMQPVAHGIELSFGRPLARFLYVAALLLLGALDHALYRLRHRVV